MLALTPQSESQGIRKPVREVGQSGMRRGVAEETLCKKGENVGNEYFCTLQQGLVSISKVYYRNKSSELIYIYINITNQNQSILRAG